MIAGKSRSMPVVFSFSLQVTLISSLFFSLAFANATDSVVTVAVAPGLTYQTVFCDGPCVVHILILDLAERDLRVESFRAVGLVPTSQQAKLNDREGHRVVAAINGDFFSFKSGWPVNNEVSNGEFVFGTQSLRSHLVLDTREKAHVERVSFDGWVKSKSGTIYSISGINDRHRNNSIVLHTSYSDTATNFLGPGKVVLLKLLQPGWSVGDTLSMVAVMSGGVDLMHIPSDEAALWIGGGSSVAAARNDIEVGDTILVYLGIEPAIRNACTVSGGDGMILSGGRPVSDSINLREKMIPAFLTSRHPRTFAGFDRDTTKLYLCVVDGRQAKSVGMSFREMADFMMPLGISTAMNFDGGGSSTMVVNGKIVNSPSDKTGERPVANSLQIVRIDSAPIRK